MCCKLKLKLNLKSNIEAAVQVDREQRKVLQKLQLLPSLSLSHLSSQTIPCNVFNASSIYEVIPHRMIDRSIDRSVRRNFFDPPPSLFLHPFIALLDEAVAWLIPLALLSVIVIVKSCSCLLPPPLLGNSHCQHFPVSLLILRTFCVFKLPTLRRVNGSTQWETNYCVYSKVQCQDFYKVRWTVFFFIIIVKFEKN